MTNLTKQQTVKNIWMHYFNNTAFEQGLINEQQWRKLHGKIEQQSTSTVMRHKASTWTA